MDNVEAVLSGRLTLFLVSVHAMTEIFCISASFSRVASLALYYVVGAIIGRFYIIRHIAECEVLARIAVEPRLAIGSGGAACLEAVFHRTSLPCTLDSRCSRHEGSSSVFSSRMTTAALPLPPSKRRTHALFFTTAPHEPHASPARRSSFSCQVTLCASCRRQRRCVQQRRRTPTGDDCQWSASRLLHSVWLRARRQAARATACR